MSTVNKPEWPAAELLLSLLGNLLVQNFSNKNVDVLLRVASLEYLGVVAARLRKDAVTSQLRTDTIDQLLKQVREDEANNMADEFKSKKHKKKKKSGVKKHEKESAPVDKTEVQTNNFSLVFVYVLNVCFVFVDSSVSATRLSCSQLSV